MIDRRQVLPRGRCVLPALGLLVLGLLLPLSAGATAQDETVTTESTTDVVQEPPQDVTHPVFGEYENVVWPAYDASGAEVAYDVPRAWDDVDGEVGVDCDANSGSWFALGDTLVTCYAEDSAGNSAALEFWVSVVDRDAPVISDRDNLVVSTDSGSAGAVVDYAPPVAYDNVDGEFGAGCDDPPGSSFSVGEHKVTCYAEDGAGNDAAPQSFFIVVVDEEAPTLYGRDDISAAAVDGSGRQIEFGLPRAVDNVDGEFLAGCDWPTTAVFPLGQTVVSCSAVDQAGNRAAPVSFVVTIYDDAAPTITPRQDITVEAKSGNGQVVTFGPPEAWDNVDGQVGVGCDPAPGVQFPVGQTTVTCYAKDGAGNDAAPFSFVITVTAPPVPSPTSTKPATSGKETDDTDSAPTAPATATLPEGTTPADKPTSGLTPTPELTSTPVPTRAATSPTLPVPPSTEVSEGNGEPAPVRPTPQPMELPWPPPGFVPITGSGPLGSLTGIWGYQSFGISQEFGHTAFSMAHSSWYAYGRNYGLDGRMHTGLDVSMPAGTWLYAPVDGTVTVSGGTPYFTYYGNGAPGVGQLTIVTADGHQVILGHMARIGVGVGQRVRAGQFVGLSGGENGDHLHLETRERQRGGFLAIVDPRQSFLTGMAGTFTLQGAPGAAGAPAGKTVGNLVATTLRESTTARLNAAVTPTPKPTTQPTPKPTTPPATTPTPKPTKTPTANPTPTQPPVVVRPDPRPRPTSPPVVVRPNPPVSTVGPPVVVANPSGGTVAPPVVVTSPGPAVASSATGPAVVTTGPTVVTTAGSAISTDPTVVTTGVTTEPVVVTGLPGVATEGPALVLANLPASRIKTPLVMTNPSLGEVDQPARATLGPVPSALPGPTVVTTEPGVVTTEPTVVTTTPAVVTTVAPAVTSEPSVVTSDPPAVASEPVVVTTEPTVVVSEPVTTEAPAVVGPTRQYLGPAPVSAPAAVPFSRDSSRVTP